jgi:tetratricopeptide (TPR) repeat protein
MEPRTDDETRRAFEAELARLAPRREALGDSGMHAVAGWTLEHAMEWEAAAMAWRRAFELDGEDVSALFHLGVCLLEQGRYAEAAETFRAASALDDRVKRLDWFDEDPEYRLGTALHAGGDLENAIAAYERSALRNMLGVDSLREVVRCRIQRVETDEALDALARMERRAVRLTVRAEVQAYRAETDALIRARTRAHRS